MRSFVRPLASAALLLGLLGALSAQDKSDKKEPDKSDKLTHKSLLEMIRKLGYEPELLGKDKTEYSIKVKLENFQSVFTVHLSGDQTRLWFTANSVKLVDVKAIPESVLRALVRLNSDESPLHFTLDEKAARVYLLHNVANKGVTAA